MAGPFAARPPADSAIREDAREDCGGHGASFRPGFPRPPEP